MQSAVRKLEIVGKDYVSIVLNIENENISGTS